MDEAVSLLDCFWNAHCLTRYGGLGGVAIAIHWPSKTKGHATIATMDLVTAACFYWLLTLALMAPWILFAASISWMTKAICASSPGPDLPSANKKISQSKTADSTQAEAQASPASIHKIPTTMNTQCAGPSSWTL